MSSPMSSYSNSQESTEFLEHFRRENVKNDPRLEFHQDIIKDFGESYERAYMLWNTYYAEAYKDLSYYLGNQWSLEELAYLNNQRRSSFTYNKIRRLINLVSGYQRKERLASTVIPIEGSSEETAQVLNDMMQYVMNSNNGYEAISGAFKNALTTGLCFLSPYIDYRDDPVSGDVRFHQDEWNAVIMDPFLTKRNLEDCSFIARRKFLSRTEVISLLPDKEDIISALPWGTRDDKFTYMPYARQWGMQKLLNYNEYWRHKWEVKDVLVDMASGETREWDGDRKRLRLFTDAYPQIEVIKKPVKSVELGIIVEGELLYYGKDPAGLNDYPFVPFFAIFEPSYDLYSWKIQSLVRIMRDPQTEINKRKSKMVDILDTSLSNGFIAKANSVSNPTSLFKSGQGQVIFLKPEAQMTDVQPIQRPSIDPSMFQLEEGFEKDMFEILGLSPENVGQAENDKVESAGILAKMRQAAGWIPMQEVFDGLRESQKLVSQKALKLIQLNYTPEKIQLITKKKPTDEFYSQVFAKYDISVEEGVLTDSQQQNQFVKLVALRQMGVDVTDEELISNSNLNDKKPMEERFKAQRDQANQVQKMQMEQAITHQAVITDSINAKAQADQSLASERLAKIQLDQALNAERISRAEEEKAAGTLNLVKALKEIQGMDLDALMKSLTFFKTLEADMNAKKEEAEGEALPIPQLPSPKVEQVKLEQSAQQQTQEQPAM